jgi:E3 ubiquitin-protein ligase SHPRH
VKLHNLLTQKLSPDQKEVDGEEYARTLEVQGEAEIYLQAYSALAADRRQVLIAERTLLAAHDARERKLRRTKAAIKASLALELISKTNSQGEAGEADTKKLEFEHGVELTPEQEVLKNELTAKRKVLLERFQGRAVKSVMVDLSNVQANITKDNDPEKAIAKDGAARVRELIASQSKFIVLFWSKLTFGIVAALMDKVDGDFALFRKAFNERILWVLML